MCAMSIRITIISYNKSLYRIYIANELNSDYLPNMQGY